MCELSGVFFLQQFYTFFWFSGIHLLGGRTINYASAATFTALIYYTALIYCTGWQC